MARILIVDDNADTINLLKTILERWGFQVVSGRNGAEGLGALSSEQPDAILSNFRMPQMDGMVFLEQVRDRSEWASIPFVMMSGLFPEEFGQDAMQRGANAYIGKPFQIHDLNTLFNDLNLKAN